MTSRAFDLPPASAASSAGPHERHGAGVQRGLAAFLAPRGLSCWAAIREPAASCSARPCWRLLAPGRDVDLGLTSTPVVQHAIRRIGAAGSVSIGASHNNWTGTR
jgi:hypothetical protein